MSKLRVYMEAEYKKELERLIKIGKPPSGVCREDLLTYWYKDQAFCNCTEPPNDLGTHLYDLYVGAGGVHYELLVHVDKHLNSFFSFLDTVEWQDLSDHCTEHELMGWFL